MPRTEKQRWPVGPPRLTVRQHDPDFVQAVQSSLDSTRALAPNWDGYGAPVIEPAVIDAAKSFIAKLPENFAPRPQVVPMSNGTLQLEWHEGPKSLEIEFESAASVRYLRWHSEEGVEDEDSFPIANLQRAIDLIRWSVT
jgi:hypothetical protein